MLKAKGLLESKTVLYTKMKKINKKCQNLKRLSEFSLNLPIK